jgi:two-component system KDP operon response regulator KdpE
MVIQTQPEILVVDDDPGVTKLLQMILEPMGYGVAIVHDGESALSALARGRPDLMILDLMLPDVDGLEICRRVRERSSLPIIALSSLNDIKSKVSILDMGADDYLTKPFRSDELVARIQALLRRVRPDEPAWAGGRITLGDLTIDLADRRVAVAGQEIGLTPTEYKLLCQLATHPGEVHTHQMLLQNVWGQNRVNDVEYLHVYIGRLRRKIELDPSKPAYIATVHGIGYMMRQLPAPANGLSH